MEHERTSADARERQRSPRFSKLPERIRLEETVEVRPPVTHDSASGAYNPDWWLIRMGGL
ncbi:hypothetical protein H4K36_35650 [Streptomyces sp. DHE7-1]|uniref:hypothetical protein n=1 Tax=unclassified Streptomyces TaxID=2593676 RepID=UPI0018EE8C1F|nr:hypothetical protein [Streptomyces sp. DHE7-1]